MIIPLARHLIVLDDRARDGTWCTSPYPGHPKGCPNFPGCPKGKVHFPCHEKLYNIKKWYAVVHFFDMAEHVRKMREKHPDWSERQLRNCRHWQNGVRKKLREEMSTLPDGILLEIPEAHGIDVVSTMKQHSVEIHFPPENQVVKVMFVGVREKTKIEEYA